MSKFFYKNTCVLIHCYESGNIYKVLETSHTKSDSADKEQWWGKYSNLNVGQRMYSARKQTFLDKIDKKKIHLWYLY